MRLRQRTRPLRAVWAPSRLRRLLRRRAVWWGAAAVFSLVGGLQLDARISAIEFERAAWGATRGVVVVDEPIVAGADIAGSVTIREFPRALLPPTAATSVPLGAVAKIDLHPGEIVLDRRMTGSNDRGLPAGFAAMTMQLFGRAPLVEIGDLVDLWVVDSADQSSRRVGERLTVLARSEEDLTVAVPHEQVAAAAVAALRPVTAVLVG